MTGSIWARMDGHIMIITWIGFGISGFIHVI